MKKLAIALGILTGFLAFAGFAFAQYSPLAPLPIGAGGATPATWTLSTYLTGAIKLLVASAGALAVVMLVIGGTQYVAAGINPSAKGDAKERISNALIGLILVLTSYLILNSIDPKLVQFNLSLSPVAAVPMKAYTAPTPVKKVWGGSLVSGGTVSTTPVPTGGTVLVAAGSSLYVSADTPVTISSPAVIKHLDGTTTNVPLSGTSTTVTVLAGETLSFPSGSSTVTLPEGGNVAVVVGKIGETKKVCPSQVDTRVVEVDGSKLIGGHIPQKIYNTTVGGTIYAFKFTAPGANMQMIGGAQGTKTTVGAAPKLVISSCKGDYGTGGKSFGCYGQGSEVSSVKFSSNYSTTVADPNKYCHLKPGETYWIHAIPVGGSDSPSNASYYFTGNSSIKQLESSASVVEDTSPTSPGGTTAETVTIGTQTWMKYNMNVGTLVSGATTQTNNSVIEKYCYNNTESNCTSQGGLYSWSEAMQGSTTEGAQGICPAGYHIPTDNEIKTLEMYLGMTQAQADVIDFRGTDQGTKLQAGGTSGFNALLSGYRNSLGSFYNLSYGARLWSSTMSDGNAWARGLYSNDTKVYRYVSHQLDGHSVRCLSTSANDTTNGTGSGSANMWFDPAEMNHSDPNCSGPSEQFNKCLKDNKFMIKLYVSGAQPNKEVKLHMKTDKFNGFMSNSINLDSTGSGSDTWWYPNGCDTLSTLPPPFQVITTGYIDSQVIGSATYICK